MHQKKSKFTRLVGLLALTSLFLFTACSSWRDGQSDGIEIAEDFMSVSAHGFSTEQSLQENQDHGAIFQIFVKNQEGTTTKDQLPVVGSYTLKNGSLTFTPSYSFGAGQSYLVRLKVDNQWTETSFTVPADDLTPKTEVDQVYPSGDILPRNILKFYIQFTDSMAARFSYRNITLLNEAQDTVKNAFLDLEEELWTPDMKRFTLLFDPGRIKRGLGSQDDLGYTFQIGSRYGLVVNGDWLDARGRVLKGSFRKDFLIGPDDRIKPDPSLWSLEYPKSATEEPVKIQFNESLDYALAGRVIELVDANGQNVAGKILLAENETQWHFYPEFHWAKGLYELRVGLILEDRSGNNIKNVFDVDNGNDQTNLTPENYLVISFRID